MAPVLEVNKIKVKYGQVEAIHDLSIEVKKGEIVSVLGANGAGKSTLLSAIMGMVKITSGEIRFNGQVINSVPPHCIPKLGIGFVPEGRRVFSDMTVQENLNIGGYAVRDKNFKKRQMEFIFDLFPILCERRKQLSGTLSGGEQQMLAMGRALMTNPSLLLLDEPSMGLAPIVINDIFLALKKVNEQGMAVLLVEQSAWLALKASKRAYVLETGNVVITDTVEALSNNPEIKKSYLGL